MWNLTIQESIKVDVTAHQSRNSNSTQHLNLSVTARNMNRSHHATVTEISMLNAALFSNNWTLLGEMVSPENTKLNSQESVHIFLKAQRKANKKHMYSLVSFVPQKQSIQYSNSAYLDFAKRNERNRVNIFDVIEVDKTKNKSDAMLILRWQARVIDSKGIKRTVYGQNQVPVYIIREEEEEDEDYVEPIILFDNNQEEDAAMLKKKALAELSLLQQQISFSLIHPMKILHDFRSKKLCIIRVKMLLHSIADTTLDVTVKTLDTASPILPFNHRLTLFSPYSSKHFRWIQAGSVIKTIDAMSSEVVELTLAVLSPGTYDLGSHVEVWCQKQNRPETAILQTCRIQSSVIVALRGS